MAFTARGLRLVNALEKYPKVKPMYFDNICLFNKIKFTSATDKHLKASMRVDSSMCNGSHFLHGGFITTLVDIMGAYANLCRTNGRMPITTNINVNYISRVFEGENIVVEAKTIKGGNSPIMETIVYTEDGNLVAKGTASFKIGNEELQKSFSNTIGFDVLKNDE